MLGVGEQAPDFEATTHDGQAISLAAFRGEKSVVLYFYPKDETSGCTAQACLFRDTYEAFTDVGAEVIGVSHDDATSHQAFAANHKLPFHLISDEDGSLRARYKVPKALGLVPGRVTYVIDQDGTIRHVFKSLLQATRHVDEALAVLKRAAGDRD